jgi:hypothetical protein
MARHLNPDATTASVGRWCGRIDVAFALLPGKCPAKGRSRSAWAKHSTGRAVLHFITCSTLKPQRANAQISALDPFRHRNIFLRMRHITAADIKAFEKLYRLNLVNAITGYKPANLIGTADGAGATNLAIFSSVVHLGSDPPLLGMVTRPTSVPRHTYENIQASGCYTINLCTPTS